MHHDHIFIQTILPKNYFADVRFNGVFCYSKDGVGIDDKTWEKILDLLKVKFGPRFTEFNYYETVQQEFLKNRLQFTVYLKP